MRRRLHNDERGVSAVIVAVSLVAIFGAAVLSIDAGNMWQTRRNIITGTDSSALQEAALASTSTAFPVRCTDAWTTAIVNNSGSLSSPISCVPTVTFTNTAGVAMNGYVVVDASKVAQARFGGAIGVGDTHPYSLSAAEWGPPNGLIGLRPFGLCDQDPHYQEWLAYAARGYPSSPGDPYNQLPGQPDHPVYSGAGVVHRIYVDNGGGSCGNAPGNWAWLDYNSGSNPTGDQRTWWSDGFTPLVGIHTGPDCTQAQATDGDPSDGCVPGNTGSRGNAFESQLAQLQASGEAVPIMIFSSLTGQGQVSIFQAVAFLSVIIRGYNVHGSNHWLDLEFVRHEWGGSCCRLGGPDNGTRVVAICEVDHDPAGASALPQRCTPSA